MDARRRSDPPPDDSVTLSGARRARPEEGEGATLGDDPPRDIASTAPDATLPSSAISAETAELRAVPREAFVVEGEHARGGVGRVLLARDPGLDRRVAIKESLKKGPGAIARFVREARLTARLQHPNIVPVYEAGRWPSGEPFYAMRLISGRSLASLVKGTRGLEERLPLVPHIIAVADAIAYAHSQRVIHRDIKPDNVLVGSFGETIVIDWGLAKDLSGARDADEEAAFGAGDEGASSDLTIAGARVGTPAYMAPEQARGERVDERADVFAIGALMFHVLAGRAPFQGPNVEAVLAAAARATPIDLEAAQPGAPRDLVTIVRKATAARAADRYPSARELADDLRRFQAGQLVGARVYSRWSIAARWLRRHRATVAVAALSIAALAVVSTLGVRRVVRERDRAEARTAELILAQARLTLGRDPTTAAAWLKSYPRDGAAWEEARVLADDARHLGLARHALLLPSPLGPSGAALASDGRVVALGHNTFDAWSAATGATIGHAPFAGARLSTLIATSGALVTAGVDGSLEITAAPGEAPARIARIAGARAIAATPDGAWIAVVGDAGPVVIDVSARAEKRLDPPPRAALTIAISPDGSRAACSADDGSSWLWDTATGARAPLPGKVARSIAPVFFASGSRVAAAGEGGIVWAWDVATRSPTALQGHDQAVVRLAGARDGPHVASADSGSAVWLWDGVAGDGRAIGAHKGYVSGLAFSPGGDLIASSSQDETTRIHRISTGESALLRGHAGLDSAPVFSRDGRTLLTAGAGVVRVWDVAPPSGRTLFGHPGRVTNVVISDDARLVATCSGRRVTIWDTATGRAIGGGAHEGEAYGIAFSPDGQWLASTAFDGSVGLWDTRGLGRSRMIRAHEGRALSAAFTPDGASLLTAGRDGALKIWDVATSEGRVLGRTPGSALRLELSSDGRTALTLGQDHVVRAWDVATGATRALGAHAGDAHYALFIGPTRAIVASPDQARVYDLDGAPPRDLPLPEGFNGGVAASPTGRHAVLSIDARFALLDLETGHARVLEGHDRPVQRVRFSRDGARIVSAGVDGTVRIWDVATAAVRTLHKHDGVVFDVAISRDARLVASVSDDKTAWIGPADGGGDALAGDATAVRAALDAWTSVEIGPRNAARTPDRGAR